MVMDNLLNDLGLIVGVMVDYSHGLQRGLSYEETENKGHSAFIKAIEIIEEIGMLYTTYGLEDDKNLTDDAKELKKVVIEFMKNLITLKDE